MLITFEVRFQHVLEPSGMVLVEVGPGEKLTVVKPRAIAQQEFDGGHREFELNNDGFHFNFKKTF